MSDQTPPINSLVLYKTRPARVLKINDKLTIELEEGETVRVRPKDIILLHPGPVASLTDLQSSTSGPGPLKGEAQTAWELLAGSTTSLAELAELAYGAFTPATAWAAWQLVADGLYFKGEPERIIACTPEEVAKTQASRQAEAAEKQAWEAFLQHVRRGRLAPEDEFYVKEIEGLALGRTTRSRVLRELGREETQENAHAILLELGYWTPFVNPYPHRLAIPLVAPDLPLPPLPQESRHDLTRLPAYAIDDVETETPDDALSLDGQRLWVHIADPAALVPPDSPLDLEARARGATTHLPEAIIPMLPPAATPLLGLGLAELSPALSFGLDLTPDGEITRLEIVNSWVQVTRLTYDEVEAQLEEEPFATFYRLALAYQARREAHGAINIELPEVSVKVRQGRVIIRPLPPLRSRTLVEAAMVMTGEAVANFALQQEIPLPFTTQEPPEPYDPPRTFSDMFALRRLLKRSQYRSVPAPHSSLGLAHYVQATSPMRRYLDLVVHQQLRAYLRGKPLLSSEAILERIGAAEVVISNIRQAEKLSLTHWTLVYLLQNPGWRGEGVLVEKHGTSSKLFIPELGLETQIHSPEELPLDSRLPLALSWVDLPRLDVRFRVLGHFR